MAVILQRKTPIVLAILLLGLAMMLPLVAGNGVETAIPSGLIASAIDDAPKESPNEVKREKSAGTGVAAKPALPLLGLAEGGKLSRLGAVIESGDTDWVASIPITNDDGTGVICTGSLVAPSWVLSANHCLAYQPRQISVYFGAQRQSKYLVDYYRSHPTADAVLLHLETPARGITPAVLSAQYFRFGTSGIEYGWEGDNWNLVSASQQIVAHCLTWIPVGEPGRFEADCSWALRGSGQTEGGHTMEPGMMRLVSQALGLGGTVSAAEFREALGKTAGDRQPGYKTQWPGVKTEHGDSGGPLVVNGKVVAILIGGTPQAAYFGAVAPLQEWLWEVAEVWLW